uniref:Integral membrane protein GPR155-like n=1 Tax=Sinocyclocheilus anshuiensis TaxID=1608454 RepID=A0A671KL77_9TELE
YNNNIHYVTIHGLNITHSPLGAPAMSIDKLFPALLECFGITLCGYMAGRSHIISVGQVKGLGNFVSCFALPALLFKNMVQLQFQHVVWSFLWSVLIAKVCVFLLVCVLTLLVANPESKYSKAGLFAIFATQSNDFALGYPIVDVLYRSSHPEYMQYIYLVAPVSLMLLNPVGFALCEIQRWRHTSDRSYSKLHVIFTVILQVLKNPIVFMVIVGILSHFLFGGHVPVLLGEFVDGLANSFGGAALFYLGLNMVGQMGKLTRATGVSLILLITAKLLVMPLLCKDMVELLDAGNSSSVNDSSLSDYAFLYGVFPTTPSVAIYAAQYNMELEVVTSGMVISTFLSAPIMYVSAWLLTIPWMEATSLVTELQDVSFNVSIVSLIALVSVSCVSMMLWKFVVKQGNVFGQILTFTLLYGSLYSTYMWTGNESSHTYSKQYFMDKGHFHCVILACNTSPLIPFLIVGGLLMIGQRMSDNLDSAFFYGKGQVVLGCSIMLGGLSLMSLSRGAQEEQNYQALDQNSMTGTTEDVRQPQTENQHSSELEQTYSSLNTGNCIFLVYACGYIQKTYTPKKHIHTYTRHIYLGLFISIIQNLSSCLWWLFNADPGRLYLELQFFCAVANYGQGFVSFGIFGLDEHLIILPFKKRLAALCGFGEDESPESAAVQEEIRLTCTQFVRYHKDQCVQDICCFIFYICLYSFYRFLFQV